MKIGIDVRLWNQTGVGRYIRNLVINLQKVDEKNQYVLFATSKDKKEIEPLIQNKSWRIETSNSRWHSLSEQISFPKAIAKQNLDLMHFPYFSVPLFYNRPFVVTIHDLILHHYPTGEASTLPLWLYGFKMIAYRLVINNAARKARKIIAVSNSTRDEIIDHLMVNKRNVEVTYEAVDDFKSSPKKEAKYKNYFMFVGNVYPHKNTEKLLRAFEAVSKTSDASLLFAGKSDFFYEKLKKQTKKFGDRIIFVDSATDSELSALYQNAICLIRPSLMEGFSLPPLEAMENQCLALVSDIAVHREILGDTAIYFDPNNLEDIIDKMNLVLKIDDKSRQKLLEKGKQKTEEFSWKKTAQETLKIYESSVSLRQSQ